MGFRFHDSLTRTTRELVTAEPGVVRMYNCGPTVYGYQHLGNYRIYTCWDVLRRALELGGFEVRQVVNVTDVGHLTIDDLADAAGEDKLELASRRENLDARAVARKYTEHFFRVAKALRWRMAEDEERRRELHPRATDYVRNDRDPHDVRTMIGHIEELIRKGHAYATPAGNVYFEVATFPAYGRLSGNTIEQLVAGARVEVLAEKRHAADFALWKRDENHQLQWESPWGRGFPGWHIECSVMARALLGDTLDIHTGGEDHLFPHHECEIAQSEGVTGKPFARLWMHGRFLQVDGKKMSKSAGRNTTYILEDIEEHYGVADDPSRARQVHRALRYFLLSAHYRTHMNFTWEALDAARSAVESLDACHRSMVPDVTGADRPEVAEACGRAERAFLEALEDDLNVSAALAAAHGFRSYVNRSGPWSPNDFTAVRATLNYFDRVLGLEIGEGPADARISEADDIQRLVDDRQAARKRRDFAAADRIRDELAARGVLLEDTPQGVQWRRK